MIQGWLRPRYSPRLKTVLPRLASKCSSTSRRGTRQGEWRGKYIVLVIVNSETRNKGRCVALPSINGVASVPFRPLAPFCALQLNTHTHTSPTVQCLTKKNSRPRWLSEASSLASPQFWRKIPRPRLASILKNPASIIPVLDLSLRNQTLTNSVF